MVEIHPSAEDNFNSKANALIERIEKVPRENQPAPRFESEIHVGAAITDKDIIGEPQEASSDYRGNTVGRFFISEGERYGLINSGHLTLVELAEQIQRLPAFRNKLSQNFIEGSIFSWLKKCFTEAKQAKPFMPTLIESANEVVKPVTVYVPVANTVVQRPFSFCGVVIRNISKSLIDEMAASGASNPDESQRANANQFFERFRRDYQGFAAVEMNLVCEPNYANDFAIMTAQRVTSFLGIYSGAMLMPDVKCISKIKGTENLAQYTRITRTDSNGLSIQRGILDRASGRHWHIAETDLDEYAKCGLGILSEITIKEQPTEFESLVLNTSLLYSKAAFTAEPLEKLVHMLSALESTLLKSENEQIQQNLAERMAIFTSQELTERKAIIRNVKAAYGLRSRYLHHGHSSSELEELSDFFVRVWVFYVQLLVNSHTFASKSEFLDAIDDQKLG